MKTIWRSLCLGLVMSLPAAQVVAQAPLSPQPVLAAPLQAAPIPMPAPAPTVAANGAAPVFVAGPGQVVEGCNSCGRSGGFYAGAAAYYLSPYFGSGSNPAYTVTTTSPGGNVTQNTQDFDWNFQVAPAFWVGWTSGDGLGLRGRYFQFNHGSDDANISNSSANTTITPPSKLQIGAPATVVLAGTPVAAAGVFGSPGLMNTFNTIRGFPLTTDSLTFSSNLNIQAADLEVTFAMANGPWDFLLSSGGRYLHLRQGYAASLTNSTNFTAFGGPPDAREVQSLSNRRTFDGGGPTVALQGNYRLGAGGLSLFGLVRGALLVGHTDEDRTFNQIFSSSLGAVFGTSINRTASSSHTTVLPVLELELGVEYARRMGRFNPFVRAAVVNQAYFNAGSASGGNETLGLFGGQLSLGLNF